MLQARWSTDQWKDCDEVVVQDTDQCCPPPPNAATPRDFHTPPPPRIYCGVKRREIGNFVAMN